eukprot:45935-Pyramimonas_sp.AAC.1
MEESKHNFNAIIFYLGGAGEGASACVIKNGTCVDTTMGLTPLEGKHARPPLLTHPPHSPSSLTLLTHPPHSPSASFASFASFARP